MKKSEKKEVAIEVVDKNKLDCVYCKEDLPHMLVILNKDGDMHVHAPFNNKYLLNEMIEAIIKEQKIYDKENNSSRIIT
jgi:hypothetical protein